MFDSLTVAALTDELSLKLLGGRIQKVLQLDADSIGFEIYAEHQRHYLVASASSRNPRLYLSSIRLSADPDSPMSKLQALAYASSKSALNAITVQFANELRDTPVKVNAVCPGYVATDLNNHSGPRTPEQGARVAVRMATLPADGPSGGYFNDDGRVPW